MNTSPPLLAPVAVIVPYTRIHNDITDYCNLRCRFCFNTWPSGKPRSMSGRTFERVLELLPLVKQSSFGFLFSCLYEPSIHPNFSGMVAMLPSAYKSRIFMTSNLAKEWTDEEIDVVAKGNIGTVNISLETYTKEFYKNLCAADRLETVLANLDRLTAAFAAVETPPRLRVTTMILRENMRELPHLAALAHSRYQASGHEFRTPYLNRYLLQNPDWFSSQLLQEKELEAVRERCVAASPVASFSLALSAEKFESFRTSPAGRERDSESIITNAFENDAVSEHGVLQIEASGRTTIFGSTPEIVDINAIETPYGFFLAKRGEQLLAAHAVTPEILSRERLRDRISRKRIGEIINGVENFELENGLALCVRGWHALIGVAVRNSLSLVLLRQDEARIFPATTAERKDIEEKLGKDTAKNAKSIQGFSCRIDIRTLPEDIYTCGVIAYPHPAQSKGFFADLGIRLDLRRETN